MAATGAAPLSYQWKSNGVSISGATNTVLTLTNVQLSQAGNYAVLVSNVYGGTLSSNAVLTVNPILLCAPVPVGLAGWWRAEGNGLDSAGTNNGTLTGNTTFGPGVVGQAFVFDGGSGTVQLGYAGSLQMQDLSIEGWIKRGSATSVGNSTDVCLLSFGYGGYGLGLRITGELFLSRIGIDGAVASTGILDTNYHHVAVTKAGTNVVFYVDGTAYHVPPYNTTFTFTTPAEIGGRGDDQGNSGNRFLGSIDEISVYRRALTAQEIQSIYAAGSNGKCSGGVPPTITSEPTNQAVLAGGTASFSVGAAGTLPLSYQWSLNGVSLSGATSAGPTLTNVQVSQAGTYAVLVGNAYGWMLSSNATLSLVTTPVITTQPAGQSVLPGCSVIFYVVASSSAPVNYQWWKNGAPLTNQTSDALTLTNVQASDFGSYQVVLRNIAGSVTSSNALLTLDHAPVAGPCAIQRYASGGAKISTALLLANASER